MIIFKFLFKIYFPGINYAFRVTLFTITSIHTKIKYVLSEIIPTAILSKVSSSFCADYILMLPMQTSKKTRKQLPVCVAEYKKLRFAINDFE